MYKQKKNLLNATPTAVDPHKAQVANELHFLTSCEVYGSIRENSLNSLNVLPNRPKFIGTEK
jgi:hypothetical protein